MQRVAILGEDVLNPDELPIRAESVRPLAFKDIERVAIENALAENDGNRTRAARQLGISLRTLQYRLKEYGMS